MKWLLAAGAAALCFIMPVGDAEATTIFHMQQKATVSLLFMIIVLLISTDWWAMVVACIELTLNVINFFIIANWPNQSWLVAHYGQIQAIAFAIEIAVILGATAHGSRISISRFADYCRRALHLARD